MLKNNKYIRLFIAFLTLWTVAIGFTVFSCYVVYADSDIDTESTLSKMYIYSPCSADEEEVWTSPSGEEAKSEATHVVVGPDCTYAPSELRYIDIGAELESGSGSSGSSYIYLQGSINGNTWVDIAGTGSGNTTDEGSSYDYLKQGLERVYIADYPQYDRFRIRYKKSYGLSAIRYYCNVCPMLNKDYPIATGNKVLWYDKINRVYMKHKYIITPNSVPSVDQLRTLTVGCGNSTNPSWSGYLIFSGSIDNENWTVLKNWGTTTSKVSFSSMKNQNFTVTLEDYPYRYYKVESFNTNSPMFLTGYIKPMSYTLSYDANGGSGAPSSSTHEKGSAATISSTEPTRSGYDFIGWSTSADSTIAEFVGGDTLEITENTTLYAVWKLQAPYFSSFQAPSDLTIVNQIKKDRPKAAF